MASLVLNGSTSGSITISSPSVSGVNVLSLPANTGTVITTGSTFAGTGPAFKVYNNTNQTISSSTFTKVQLNTKVFDTNTNFDNTTNYRFTPTVAGYYKISGNISSAASTSQSRVIVLIYKNATAIAQVDGYPIAGGGGASVSVDVSMNGSTDYLELYAYVTATTPILYCLNESLCFMSGVMTRSA
jgi:hypothetical protein